MIRKDGNYDLSIWSTTNNNSVWIYNQNNNREFFVSVSSFSVLLDSVLLVLRTGSIFIVRT